MCGTDGHTGTGDLVVSSKARLIPGGAYSTHMEDATTDPDACYDASSTSSGTHTFADSFETMNSRSPACSSGEKDAYDAILSSSDSAFDELYGPHASS